MSAQPRITTKKSAPGFTLVEVLLATAILGLLVAMFATLVAQTSSLWQRTTGKIEQFREARNAFEYMTTRLSQATLNTYWDYVDASGAARTEANSANFKPARYTRQSELRFISGPAKTLLTTKEGAVRLTHAVFFIAPLGYSNNDKYENYNNLLCACGYYLEYGDDSALRPSFLNQLNPPIPPRYRHRLMEFIAPTENKANNIYAYTSPPNAGASNTKNTKLWYQPLVDAVASAGTPANYHPIAENIVALIITPRLSQSDEKDLNGGTVTDDSKIAPNYLYDTTPAAASDARYSNPLLNPTNQLPPILQVTMVAIDELSANRLNLTASSADLFSQSTKFANAADYSKDLLQSADNTNSLEALLISRQVNYRIFNTNVSIRGAKWSRAQ